MQSITFSDPWPTQIEFYAKDKVYLTIYADGRVVVDPSANLDEAATAFFETIRRIAPSMFKDPSRGA